ncbi:hypothetical protein PGT21_016079 [Puccinia graminis f. sp. tritici]|uniref:Uncharacterized protein n=1 Tax=Puccinia graminis f. sp. tritici TaxID=56615 RepID=A0A5B0MXR5_PUCGR|nr:hypothetical protein PGT21_016079 [Puccinia graminis f. sp. tritici]
MIVVERPRDAVDAGTTLQPSTCRPRVQESLGRTDLALRKRFSPTSSLRRSLWSEERSKGKPSYSVQHEFLTTPLLQKSSDFELNESDETAHPLAAKYRPAAKPKPVRAATSASPGCRSTAYYRSMDAGELGAAPCRTPTIYQRPTYALYDAKNKKNELQSVARWAVSSLGPGATVPREVKFSLDFKSIETSSESS